MHLRKDKESDGVHLETDEDAEKFLNKNGSAAERSTVGIYYVFRNRDGMSIADAVMAALNHVIGVYEGKNVSRVA
jgi:hypothetical protein